MSAYLKAMATLIATGFAVCAVLFGMTYTYMKGFENGRQHQADIDYRIMQYLCSSGETFNVDPHGKFRCMRQTSI